MRGKQGTAGICIPRSAAHASDLVLRNTGDHAAGGVDELAVKALPWHGVGRRPRGGDGPSGPRMYDVDGMGGLGRSPGGFSRVRGAAPRQKFGVSKGISLYFEVFPLDLPMDACGANGSASHVHHRSWRIPSGKIGG